MSILTEKQLSTQIKAIKANSAKLREAIQEALVSATYYAYKDGDTGPLNRILEAVGDNTRKVGLTAWVELVAGIARIDKGQFVLNKKVRNEAGVTNEETFAKVEEACRAVNWWDAAKKEEVVSVWDGVAVMEKEAKGLARLADKAEAEGDAIAAAKLREARMVIVAFLNDSTYAVEEMDVQPQVRLAA